MRLHEVSNTEAYLFHSDAKICIQVQIDEVFSILMEYYDIEISQRALNQDVTSTDRTVDNDDD